MRQVLLILCAIWLCHANPAAADDNPCKGTPHEGVWTASKPMKIPMLPACNVKYSCGPKETSMNDASCKMSVDSAVIVRGSCSAGKGAVDECNSCLTAPPSKTCYYRWVKR